MATITSKRADAGRIRRYYDRMRVAVPGSRARADVLALLEERKRLARAGDLLLAASAPYSGDPNVKAAVDQMRAALEGTG